MIILEVIFAVLGFFMYIGCWMMALGALPAVLVIMAIWKLGPKVTKTTTYVLAVVTCFVAYHLFHAPQMQMPVIDLCAALSAGFGAFLFPWMFYSSKEMMGKTLRNRHAEITQFLEAHFEQLDVEGIGLVRYEDIEAAIASSKNDADTRTLYAIKRCWEEIATSVSFTKSVVTRKTIATLMERVNDRYKNWPL